MVLVRFGLKVKPPAGVGSGFSSRSLAARRCYFWLPWAILAWMAGMAGHGVGLIHAVGILDIGYWISGMVSGQQEKDCNCCCNCFYCC